MLCDLADKKHELAAGSGQQVAAILHKADQFDEAIEKPQEEVLASEIFFLAAHTGRVVAENLAKGGKSYTPADFVRRLKSHYVDDADALEVGASDPGAFQWSTLGHRLSGWFRPAPATYHMLGPMDAAPKAKRPVAQRRKRQEIAEAVRPDEVAQQGEEKQETDRNMETMWEVLSQQPEATAYMLELVTNHASFAQTIENMFTLSFLVKDGRVELKNGPRGIMVTKVQQGPRKDKAARAADAERVQFIVAINTEEWEEWKKVTKSSDCLMPHREHHNHEQQQPEDDDEAPAPAKKRGRPSK